MKWRKAPLPGVAQSVPADMLTNGLLQLFLFRCKFSDERKNIGRRRFSYLRSSKSKGLNGFWKSAGNIKLIAYWGMYATNGKVAKFGLLFCRLEFAFIISLVTSLTWLKKNKFKSVNSLNLKYKRNTRNSSSSNWQCWLKCADDDSWQGAFSVINALWVALQRQVEDCCLSHTWYLPVREGSEQRGVA